MLERKHLWSEQQQLQRHKGVIYRIKCRLDNRDSCIKPDPLIKRRCRGFYQLNSSRSKVGTRLEPQRRVAKKNIPCQVDAITTVSIII